MGPLQRTPGTASTAFSQDPPWLRRRERISLVKNRMREICTSGSVRDGDGNAPIYSAQLPAGAMLQCPGQPLDLFEARRRGGLDFEDDIFAVAMGDQIRRQRAQKFRQFPGRRFYRNLI